MARPYAHPLHNAFTTYIYPAVLAWARKSFRRDEDAVAEAVALAWKWSVRLHDKGRDPVAFRSNIAQYAVRAVKSGRKVAGMITAKDAMNPLAWQRAGFTVQRFPEHGSIELRDDHPLTLALADHRNADVADHVAFKIDWPTFLAQQNERYQKLVELFTVGESNKSVAKQLGVSQGRCTQIRQALRDRWNELQGEA